MMIVKRITLSVPKDHLDDFWKAQEIWNRQTRGAAGYLGCFCGHRAGDPSTVELLFYWRSRAELDRWMSEEHDRIAAIAGSDRFYDSIETKVIEQKLAPESWDGA